MECPKCSKQMTTYHSKEQFKCKECRKVINFKYTR